MRRLRRCTANAEGETSSRVDGMRLNSRRFGGTQTCMRTDAMASDTQRRCASRRSTWDPIQAGRRTFVIHFCCR